MKNPIFIVPKEWTQIRKREMKLKAEKTPVFLKTEKTERNPPLEAPVFT